MTDSGGCHCRISEEVHLDSASVSQEFQRWPKVWENETRLSAGLRKNRFWAQMSRGHVEAVSALFSAISPDTKSPMKAWNALQAMATHCSPVTALASFFPYRPALSQAPRYTGFMMSSKDWSGHTGTQADHETCFKQRPLKHCKHVLLWLLFLLLLLTSPLFCSAGDLARTLTNKFILSRDFYNSSSRRLTSFFSQLNSLLWRIFFL